MKKKEKNELEKAIEKIGGIKKNEILKTIKKCDWKRRELKKNKKRWRRKL